MPYRIDPFCVEVLKGEISVPDTPPYPPRPCWTPPRI